MHRALLALGVGLALADSSIVTLALPEILGQFDVAITSVAWVLTSFNLVLALLAVSGRVHLEAAPTRGVRVREFRIRRSVAGLRSRAVVRGARRSALRAGRRRGLVVTAALDLLSDVQGGDETALRTWVTAGILGAALGPAAGGILTQVLGWESIFLVQVPLALALLFAVRGVTGRPTRAPAGRPSITANSALLLVAGGLVAALFLVVLLLVDGWGMSPAAAGVVVTVIPVVAIVVGRLRPSSLGPVQGIACGVILLAGGLAALALMPRSGWVWTIPPQMLVGAGLGLTVGGLTEYALRNRPDLVVHGGWTIAARHAGVVVGLVLLAPVLTTALEENRDEAIRAGAAVVLDSEIPPLDKLGVAQDVLAEVDRANEVGELPDVERAFEGRPDDDEWRALIDGLQEQLDRAVTSAFSGPFLLAAALTLCALVPVALMRRRVA